ncbi:hypothetical protein KIN20_013003 [Parelaphostrongylus tenuis]|uniref:Uncharacterized protein n=1 Tax=Parelaphostrongylus tenuis TaxID=148309 RepID=A0AAD5QN68_PARTN|nr:hypothetical protein KIN20_013003 [Parelaphostrongylus tenuis]
MQFTDDLLCHSWDNVFDQLVNEVLNDKCTSALKLLGVEKIKIQLGAGSWSDDVRVRVFNGVVEDQGDGESGGLPVEFYRFKPNIQDDMKDALVSKLIH